MKLTTCLFAAMVISVAPPALAGDCPAAVTSAIEKAHAKSKTLACNSEKDDGSIVYEVKVRTADGKKLEMDVSPDGDILVTEEHIAVGGVPASAMKPLVAKFADAKISDAERLTAKDGGVSFELTFISGGKEHEMTVNEAGEVLSLDDEEVDPEDDPAADDKDAG